MPAGGSPNGRDFESVVCGAFRDFIEATGQLQGMSILGLKQTERQQKRRGLLLSGPGSWSALFIDEPAQFDGVSPSIAVDQRVADPFRRTLSVADIIADDDAEGSVRFDMACVLLDADQVVERMLFEFKFGKSSGGDRLDGNAHERLAYQTLMFLLWSERNPEPPATLTVIASSAFSAYRNKYERSFRAIGRRMGTLSPTFEWRFLAELAQYEGFFSSLDLFLRTGARPPT